MKRNIQINQTLNAALRYQLTAINQYFLHARICNNWGFEQLNSTIYKRSIKAMKQADALIERLLFLQGLPNLQDLGKIYIGEDVPEIMSNDMRMASEVTEQLRTAISLCEEQQDYVSRDILENILKVEEDSIDWLEAQNGLIETTGLPNYLQSMM